MRERGLSLVECLLALALFSLVAGRVLTLLLHNQIQAADHLHRVQALGLAHASAAGISFSVPAPFEVHPVAGSVRVFWPEHATDQRQALVLPL